MGTQKKIDGRRLRLLRSEYLGMTGANFAESVGLTSRSTISAIENGRQDGGRALVNSIVRIYGDEYGVTANWLAGVGPDVLVKPFRETTINNAGDMDAMLNALSENLHRLEKTVLEMRKYRLQQTRAQRQGEGNRGTRSKVLSETRTMQAGTSEHEENGEGT